MIDVKLNVVEFLAVRTIRTMIGFWHDDVTVSLSVCDAV